MHFRLLTTKPTRELWNGCSFEHTHRFEHIVVGHAQILGTGFAVTKSIEDHDIGVTYNKTMTVRHPGSTATPSSLAWRRCPAHRRPSGQSVPVTEPDGVLGELLARCRADHLAWINGDAAGYALPADGTIFGGVGGYGFGGPETAAGQAAVAAQWRSGSGNIEFLNGGATGALAWLCFIERAVVVFEGDPAERRWELRVTEVFRHNGDAWDRVHRHADPLIDRRSLPEVASLLV